MKTLRNVWLPGLLAVALVPACAAARAPKPSPWPIGPGGDTQTNTGTSSGSGSGQPSAGQSPFALTTHELHFQAGHRLIAKGLKDLEGWFYGPGLQEAPWANRDLEALGYPPVGYGEGELPIGGFYDPSCPHCPARGNEEWKFLELVDLHRQSPGDFPGGQYLTVRLGNAAHQSGSTYIINTIARPEGSFVSQDRLVRAKDWYFQIVPTGGECVVADVRIQLPSATLWIEPARILVNWADHGWGVRFPGAHIDVTGLSAKARLKLCVEDGLQPTGQVQDIQIDKDHIDFRRDGDIDVDIGFAGSFIPGVGDAVDWIVGQMVGRVVNRIGDVVVDITARDSTNQAFAAAREMIRSQALTAANAELDKLLADLPRVQPSLRDGCSALSRALDDGILDAIRRPSTRQAVRRIVTAQCARLTDDTASIVQGPVRFEGTTWGWQNGCYNSLANVEESLEPGAWASFEGQDWYAYPRDGSPAPYAPPSSPFPLESGCRVDAIVAVSLPDSLWPVMRCVTSDVNDWLNNTVLDPDRLAENVKVDCFGPIWKFVETVENYGSGNRVRVASATRD